MSSLWQGGSARGGPGGGGGGGGRGDALGRKRGPPGELGLPAAASRPERAAGAGTAGDIPPAPGVPALVLSGGRREPCSDRGRRRPPQHRAPAVPRGGRA